MSQPRINPRPAAVARANDEAAACQRFARSKAAQSGSDARVHQYMRANPKDTFAMVGGTGRITRLVAAGLTLPSARGVKTPEGLAAGLSNVCRVRPAARLVRALV